MSKPKKSASLLPPDHAHDGPLFFVITTIVFLASLAAVAAQVSMANANHWRAQLKTEMTVQVLSGDAADAKTAAEALRTLKGIESVRIADRADARKLLEPWLGADNIPDDLPIPLLVYVKLDPRHPPLASDVEARLRASGVETSVDDHQRWAAGLTRAARTVQMLAFGIFSILVAAAIAVTGFATRTGLAARRDLVDVLHLVGAKDGAIARLFAGRFLMLGLKAGVVGTLLAMACIGILMLTSAGAASLLGNVGRPGLSAYLLLLPAPMLAATVGAITAHASVTAILRRMSP